MEPPDDWTLSQECTGTEIGAGHLRKKGKGADVWSKRYIVLDKNKLIYYMDQTREVVKGEIIIAGATAANCTTRPDEEKKFYFTISHPVCGIREFYAKTDARRRQWLQGINTMSANLIRNSTYGTIYKLGGLTGKTWQERWCVCTGETMDYFDSCTDNQSKGCLSMKGAAVRKIKRDDQTYCFEIEEDGANVEQKKNLWGGVKANKKYIFAVSTPVELDRWVEVLTAASVYQSTAPPGGDIAMTDNPMHRGAGGMKGVMAFKEKEIIWPVKDGLLAKKSKNAFSLSAWQDRWFVLDQAHRALLYYKDKGERDSGAPEKGKIPVENIIGEKFVLTDRENPAILRFYVRPNNRKYELKAESSELAQQWVEALNEWLRLLKEYPNAGESQTSVAEGSGKATDLPAAKAKQGPPSAPANDDDD